MFRNRVIWQLLFIAYFVALSIATHWPRLQLPPETPASDKSIHVIAFGIGTMLLWATAWIRPFWLLGLSSLLWAALDESTQAIPAIQRHASLHDFIANAIGVIGAMLLIALLIFTLKRLGTRAP